MSVPNLIDDRRWVVFGAILIQLCLGAIYAWSVFTGPLKDLGWTAVDTQYVFAAGLLSFASVMVLAGRLMPRWGPTKLALAGGLTLGAGYILAGLSGGTSFWPVFIGVGLIGGSGIGLAYVVPIAVGMRWFPDKKGLITGLAVAGFGFGAMLWVKLAGAWGGLIADYGLGVTFTLYGVLFALLVALGARWMVFPDEAPAGSAEAKGMTSSEMLKTWQFYWVFLAFAVSAGAGLMSIGLMNLYPSQALMASGMEKAAAVAAAGTAMAVFFSLANGIGRIAWGWLSDLMGKKLAIVTMMASQGALLLAFPSMAGSEYALYLGATLIGFNFGGNFALFPVITSHFFGPKFIGQNYGWVFLSYGLGGVAFPILGGRLGDLGNYPLAFTICGVLCLAAVAAIAPLRQPRS